MSGVISNFSFKISFILRFTGEKLKIEGVKYDLRVHISVGRSQN